MIKVSKGKTLRAKWLNEEGGGVNDLRFSNGLGISRIGGSTIPQYLSYKNCDISPITKKSKGLVSHFL